MPGSFIPTERVLMGPGPSNIHPRVLEALSRPTIGHLDPEFTGMMDELKGLLQLAFQTKNEMTFPVSAPGSAGMECCFVNLVEPGDKIIVCQNGVFGGRMKENVERCGGIPIMVEDEWGTVIDCNKLENTLKQNPDTKIISCVHAETSTGVLSDVITISGLAQKYDCLTIVDTVTSLGGSPLDVDGWKLDAVYSGSQKCLSCTPGLSPVTFSDKALDVIRNRKTKVQSWFLDLQLVMKYWGHGEEKRTYHHTAPVNALYALHEALLLLLDEGLETAWTRHTRCHTILKKGLEKLGFTFIVEESGRLPQLNAVSVPAGIDEAALRSRLLLEHNLEVGAGLGALAGKIWRIGIMGYGCNEKNISFLLNTLKKTM